MHHYIFIKIKADTADDAKDEVSSAMEDSLNPENNTVGWDYVGDIVQVTEENISKFSNTHKTPKGLEKYYKEIVHTNKQRDMDILNDFFFVALAEKFMPDKEIPLYVADQGKLAYYDQISKTRIPLSNILAKRLKSPVKHEQPSYEDLIKEIIKTIFSDSMIPYYIKQVEKTQSCIDYPDEKYYSLQCTNNHFVDLGGDGEHIYYFLADRHY